MASFLKRPLRYSFYNATIILIVVNLLVFLAAFTSRQLRGMIVAYSRPDSELSFMSRRLVAGGHVHVRARSVVGTSFFNMLALFSSAYSSSGAWAAPSSCFFYFFCGIGAGIATVLVQWRDGTGDIPTIGASGAIYGRVARVRRFLSGREDLCFRNHSHACSGPGGRIRRDRTSSPSSLSLFPALPTSRTSRGSPSATCTSSCGSE